eukprot:scaffold116494_cov16-Prasinocladus_malaysianus.AAC.1
MTTTFDQSAYIKELLLSHRILCHEQTARNCSVKIDETLSPRTGSNNTRKKENKMQQIPCS